VCHAGVCLCGAPCARAVVCVMHVFAFMDVLVCMCSCSDSSTSKSRCMALFKLRKALLNATAMCKSCWAWHRCYVVVIVA